MPLKEVEVVGVMQDVRDYDGDPCDKGVFLPQNQIEDRFHEWDIGEAHRADVLDSEGNREINKQKLGKRRQNLQSNR